MNCDTCKNTGWINYEEIGYWSADEPQVKMHTSKPCYNCWEKRQALKKGKS